MRRMIEADAFGLAARIFAVDQGHRHPVGNRVEERDGNLAAVAGARPGVERLQDRRVGVHAAADVRDGDADAARRIRAAGDRGETRLALNEKVVSLHLGVRAAFAIAGDVADDEARVLGPEGLRAETGPLRRARREILHEDVRPFQHPLQKGGNPLVA